MRTYAMGYREVMDMPMRAFWTVSGFVDRVFADEGQLTLELKAASQDVEAAQTLMERMKKQAPSPVKLTVQAQIERSAVRDVDGFAALKGLAG